jgi:hypothetical protein
MHYKLPDADKQKHRQPPAASSFRCAWLKKTFSGRHYQEVNAFVGDMARI